MKDEEGIGALPTLSLCPTPVLLGERVECGRERGEQKGKETMSAKERERLGPCQTQSEM